MSAQAVRTSIAALIHRPMKDITFLHDLDPQASWDAMAEATTVRWK